MTVLLLSHYCILTHHIAENLVDEGRPLTTNHREKARLNVSFHKSVLPLKSNGNSSAACAWQPNVQKDEKWKDR